MLLASRTGHGVRMGMFGMGILTYCLHVYCGDCLSMWNSLEYAVLNMQNQTVVCFFIYYLCFIFNSENAFR